MTDLDLAIHQLETVLPVADRAALRVLTHPALTCDDKHELVGAISEQWDQVERGLRLLRRLRDQALVG